MDLAALTLSVLVKQINRSNSSRDGFYTVHQSLSIGLTPVQPDCNSVPPDILDNAYFESCMIEVDTRL